ATVSKSCSCNRCSSVTLRPSGSGACAPSCSNWARQDVAHHFIAGIAGVGVPLHHHLRAVSGSDANAGYFGLGMTYAVSNRFS
ncbi:hypothetical protein, partial [Pseudomonas aeruginosa]|uniref:hypothetical protein n=1 Tax=Pseudomonas aeruginosa TaxID=287 RepID=UPI00402B5A7C